MKSFTVTFDLFWGDQVLVKASYYKVYDENLLFFISMEDSGVAQTSRECARFVKGSYVNVVENQA